jgi:hypothetical protein
MKTLKARVLGVLELQPYRMKGKSGDQSKNTIINFWHSHPIGILAKAEKKVVGMAL